MKITFLTIFPQIFNCYLNETILKRAQKKKLVKFNIVDIRDFATDKHKTVDDKPYGGGPGMVLKIDPIFLALKSIIGKKMLLSHKRNALSLKNTDRYAEQRRKIRVILLSAKGKTFDQKMARKLSKYKHLIFICGRYEGVDERVAKYLADEEISIGDYVLTGGELPAMVVVDAMARHIKGVLGKEESLEEKRFGVGVPVYTRPENFMGWKVPRVLLSGDHKKIEEWRRRHSYVK